MLIVNNKVTWPKKRNNRKRKTAESGVLHGKNSANDQ